MLNFQFTEHAKRKGLDKRFSVKDIVGEIPFFVQETDGRPAKEQINDRYSFGGGWRPFEGFVMDKETKAITYSEDPPLYPIVVAKYKDQEIYVYDYAWVNIVNPNGSFEIARLD